MAVTILRNHVSPQLPPLTRVGFYQITFTGTYPAGGESITAANLGLTVLYNVQLTESPIGYTVNMIPTTPAASNGAFSTFKLGWEDGTAAGAVAELAAGAYPALITGGYVYALVLGR